MKLPKHIGIYKYTIELIKGKQLPHKFMYTLSSVELKTLQVHIKTHHKTGFIQPSNFSSVAFILFDKKLNSSFWLCVNYRGLNYLTIKNWYPFPLIGEALDHLDQGKRFTELNFTSAYHQM